MSSIPPPISFKYGLGTILRHVSSNASFIVEALPTTTYIGHPKQPEPILRSPITERISPAYLIAQGYQTAEGNPFPISIEDLEDPKNFSVERLNPLSPIRHPYGLRTPLREHVYEQHTHCSDPGCNICIGGLAFCVVCKRGEGQLSHSCPGHRPFEDLFAIALQSLLDCAPSIHSEIRNWETGVYEAPSAVMFPQGEPASSQRAYVNARIASLKTRLDRIDTILEEAPKGFWSCSGCGSQETLRQLKARQPLVKSCCPERRIVIRNP